MRQEQLFRRAASANLAPRSIARSPRHQESTACQAIAQLATASHDLRDPLQVIAANVDLIADGFCGSVTNEQRACLERVRLQIDQLSAVVGSVLTLARATHRGRMLELSNVPVPQLLEHVRNLVEPFAAAAGVFVVVDCEEAPAVVRAERTALIRVLVNLAVNGIKVTPRGGRVFLTAMMLADAMELRVADSGPGIPSDQLTAILEPFVQIHPTHDVKRGGVGLGLTIARDLTRLMGGELLVDSIVGMGSVFTVRLPGSPILADAVTAALVPQAA